MDRRELPAALLQGRIYVPGGFGDDHRVLATVDAYDPQADAWSSAPPMPEPRHHHGAAVASDRLYVIGGYSTLGPNWALESSTFEFDPATGAWRARAPLPMARGAMAVASMGGTIYVFGGAAGVERSETYIYDPAADRWSAGAPMPSAREHVAAVAIGSAIFVAGGRSFNGGNLAALEAYSPATDSWRTLAPMRVARSGHGIGTMGGRLYVFGGEDLRTGRVLDSVEEYDPQTDKWRDVAPLPGGLTGVGAVGSASAIHVVGGANANNVTQRTHLLFRLP